MTDHLDIIIRRQGICQNRNQLAIQLDSQNLSGCFTEILGQCPDPGSDLENEVLPADLGGVNNSLQNMPVNQKILSVFLLKREAVFLQDRDGAARTSQSCHLSPPDIDASRSPL